MQTPPLHHYWSDQHCPGCEKMDCWRSHHHFLHTNHSVAPLHKKITFYFESSAVIYTQLVTSSNTTATGKTMNAFQAKRHKDINVRSPWSLMRNCVLHLSASAVCLSLPAPEHWHESCQRMRNRFWLPLLLPAAMQNVTHRSMHTTSHTDTHTTEYQSLWLTAS